MRLTSIIGSNVGNHHLLKTSSTQAVPDGQSGSTPSLIRRPILVCEDDDGIRELLVEAIQEEGFEVQAVRNGREALVLLSREPGRYLLLMDLMMPELSGYGVLEQMNASPALLSDNIVVVVSATGFIRPISPGILEKRMIRGTLKKPFELEDLFALLHQLA